MMNGILKFFSVFSNAFALKNSAGSKLHPITLLNYWPRFLGHFLGSILILVVLIERGLSPAFYPLLVFQGVIWSQIVLILSMRSKNPKNFELHMLKVDLFITGIWVPLVAFQPIVVFTIACMSLTGCMALNGVRTFINGAVSFVLGAIFMSLLVGVTVEYSSSLTATTIGILSVFLSTSVMSYLTYLRSGQLIAIKKKQKRLNSDLESANEEVKAQRDEVIQSRDNLKKTLDELEFAQKKLVQQEKLASLGQLTAGIAHEIKNPLNFVTNFSDLTRSLIDELHEELSRPVAERDQELIEEIIEDIRLNTNKIYEHGTRADNIVQSMLQHSRGGSGVFEEIDLNNVILEYFNLSYHGMRASKKSINVQVNHQLDENIPKALLMKEDFGRVIINLCNNAFDAMRAVSETGYKPRLVIRSKQDGDNIIIEFEDNGYGIPEEIKDNIFQPFFTTKKGTEGTGLGLSITNDVVKAHGGELTVANHDNGAVFKIILPMELE